MAGINRRLVTTDSYDLPVTGGTIPNPSTVALGPDGMPGQAGIDDDNANGIDDIIELTPRSLTIFVRCSARKLRRPRSLT